MFINLLPLSDKSAFIDRFSLVSRHEAFVYTYYYKVSVAINMSFCLGVIVIIFAYISIYILKGRLLRLISELPSSWHNPLGCPNYY